MGFFSVLTKSDKRKKALDHYSYFQLDGNLFYYTSTNCGSVVGSSSLDYEFIFSEEVASTIEIVFQDHDEICFLGNAGLVRMINFTQKSFKLFTFTIPGRFKSYARSGDGHSYFAFGEKAYVLTPNNTLAALDRKMFNGAIGVCGKQFFSFGYKMQQQIHIHSFEIGSDGIPNVGDAHFVTELFPTAEGETQQIHISPTGDIYYRPISFGKFYIFNIYNRSLRAGPECEDIQRKVIGDGEKFFIVKGKHLSPKLKSIPEFANFGSCNFFENAK